jgi:hypothetical protein
MAFACQLEPGFGRLPPPTNAVPLTIQIAADPVSFCKKMLVPPLCHGRSGEADETTRTVISEGARPPLVSSRVPAGVPSVTHRSTLPLLSVPSNSASLPRTVKETGELL